MKKLIFAMIVITIILTGCGNAAQDPQEQEETKKYEMTTETPGVIVVGINVGEQGRYTTFSDVELGYMDGELTYIEITDPVLLAFRVSERWPGGCYIYSREEIQRIIDDLDQLRGIKPDPTLDEVIDQLQNGLLMIEAST